MNPVPVTFIYEGLMRTHLEYPQSSALMSTSNRHAELPRICDFTSGSLTRVECGCGGATSKQAATLIAPDLPNVEILIRRCSDASFHSEGGPLAIAVGRPSFLSPAGQRSVNPRSGCTPGRGSYFVCVISSQAASNSPCGNPDIVLIIQMLQPC
jgi:hypothetical protein